MSVGPLYNAGNSSHGTFRTKPPTPLQGCLAQDRSFQDQKGPERTLGTGLLQVPTKKCLLMSEVPLQVYTMALTTAGLPWRKGGVGLVNPDTALLDI